jgi:hypothetical protein
MFASQDPSVLLQKLAHHPAVKQYRQNAPKPPPAKTEAVSVFTEIKQEEKFLGNAKKGGLPSLQNFRATASVDVVDTATKEAVNRLAMDQAAKKKAKKKH